MPQALTVPFGEKDEAKALGARWDATGKTWYVPDGVDLAPFHRWKQSVQGSGPPTPKPAPKPAPAPPPTFQGAPQVKASSFAIARSEQTCFKCKKPTQVYAVALLRGYEQLEDDEADIPAYQAVQDRAFLAFPRQLDPQTLSQFARLAPNFRYATTSTAGDYLANHCGHCGVVQGDFFLHSEPGGAFFPETQAAAARIVMQHCAIPLEAEADVGWGSWMDWLSKY